MVIGIILRIAALVLVMVIMVVVRSMRITAGGVRAILESYVRNSQAGLVYLVNISKECGKIHNGVKALVSSESESKSFF